MVVVIKKEREMTEYVKLTWLQKPIPWARPGGKTIRYDTQKKDKNYMGYIARKQMGSLPPIDCPCVVKLEFYFVKPSHITALYPSWKFDIDNLSKFILDVCNGIAYKDDGLIVRLVATKLWSLDRPKIVMSLYKI